MDIADQQTLPPWCSNLRHPGFHATHMMIVTGLLFYTISGQFLHVCAGRVSHHFLPVDSDLQAIQC